MILVWFDLTFFSIDQPSKQRTAGFDDHRQRLVLAAEREKRKLRYEARHLSKLNLLKSILDQYICL